MAVDPHVSDDEDAVERERRRAEVENLRQLGLARIKREEEQRKLEVGSLSGEAFKSSQRRVKGGLSCCHMSPVVGYLCVLMVQEEKQRQREEMDRAARELEERKQEARKRRLER